MLTPRQKLFAALGGLTLLPLLAAAQGLTAASMARVVLGLAAAAGLGVWFYRARRGLMGKSFQDAARLTVVQRVGLSQRTGLALVEVDGRPYLVVHGDGFARIRPAARPKVLSRRRAEPAPELTGAPS